MKDRVERRRLSWIAAYQALGDAGAVCRRFGISRPTLRKWLRRYEAEGEAGLRDRSRRPHRSPGLKADKRQQLPSARLIWISGKGRQLAKHRWTNPLRGSRAA